jgi:hypothetical protein
VADEELAVAVVAVSRNQQAMSAVDWADDLAVVGS